MNPEGQFVIYMATITDYYGARTYMERVDSVTEAITKLITLQAYTIFLESRGNSGLWVINSNNEPVEFKTPTNQTVWDLIKSGVRIYTDE